MIDAIRDASWLFYLTSCVMLQCRDPHRIYFTAFVYQDGKTALRLAFENNHSSVVDLLKTKTGMRLVSLRASRYLSRCAFILRVLSFYLIGVSVSAACVLVVVCEFTSR